MYIKKFVCSLLTIVMLFTYMLSSVISFADDNIFDFTDLGNGYSVTLKSNYLDLLNDQKDLIIPESYMSKSVTTANSLGVITSDSKIESIVYPSGVATSVLRQFRFFSKLTSVSWKSPTLNLNANTFRDCSNSLTSVYIYATSLIVADSAFRTINANSNAKIYVTSEEAKNQIVTATAGGSYPVQASQIEVMQATKPTATVEVSCVDIISGTEGGFKPSAVVKVDGNVVVGAGDKAIWKLYTDVECKNEYTTYKYNSTLLPVGTYYFKATVAGTDDYTGAVSDVLEVHVLPNVIKDETMDALKDAIKDANDFKTKNEASKDNYDGSAWYAVYGQINAAALYSAELIANDESGAYTDAQAQEAIKALKEALEALDLSKYKKSLDKAVKEAEALDAKMYTDESYEKLTTAIENAKQLNGEATKDNFNDFENAKQAIDNAKAELEYKPADYSAVDKAIAEIPSDLSKYTEETVKALNEAKESVVRGKNITEQATVDGYAKAISEAIKALVEKPSNPTNSKEPATKPTATTPVKTTSATRDAGQVAKDKNAAKKAMKQAKITKLKVKSKAKKKINVSWKKVKKAKGYQVQVSAKKNFKKVIFKKDLKKTKLTIKNKKINSKKKYFVRVRAYATYKDKNNKTVKVYSKWNKKLRKVSVK